MDGMQIGELLNVVLGGSLVGAIVSIVTIRSALKKARAEADKAFAESDTVKITNTEQATRILVENIVNPLVEELNETRKEVNSLKREVARFRKAIDGANSCRYSSDCPVLMRMRDSEKERPERPHVAGREVHSPRQHRPSSDRHRERGGGEASVASDGGAVGGDADDLGGQPP